MRTMRMSAGASWNFNTCITTYGFRLTSCRVDLQCSRRRIPVAETISRRGLGSKGRAYGDLFRVHLPLGLHTTGVFPESHTDSRVLTCATVADIEIHVFAHWRFVEAPLGIGTTGLVCNKSEWTIFVFGES